MAMPIKTPSGRVLSYDELFEAGQIMADRIRERNEAALDGVLRNTGNVIEGEYRVVEEERPALGEGTEG